MSDNHQTVMYYGVQYERWVYEGESPPHWTPVKYSETDPIICGKDGCMGTSFTVLCKAGAYETVARCIKCGLEDIVHSG